MTEETLEQSTTPKPEYLRDLEAAYGPPSREAFGSAVFSQSLDPDGDLEQAALEKYRYFVGDVWERYGEEVWMAPWKEVYSRDEDTPHDIVAELRAIEDPSRSVSMILDVVKDPEGARTALSGAYDDPAVTELAVYDIGDGGAMSGLIVAGQRETSEAIFLVFLMD